MQYERERLKTFDDWHVPFIDKNVLARIGMFYTGQRDKVECFFCEIEIENWHENDNPVNEHNYFSPDCPLMNRCTTTNIPIDGNALNEILERNHRRQIGELPEELQSSYVLIPRRSRNSAFPEYPKFAMLSDRIKSFSDWPKCMSQRPEKLSEAGFFYSGIDDQVKCYSCGGGLKDWEPGDDPWEQHALWLGSCKFLKLIKGEDFINMVKGGKKKVEEEKEEPKNGDDSKICKICYVNEYNTVFLPCGHVVACVECASSLLACPICKKPYTDITRIFFS